MYLNFLQHNTERGSQGEAHPYDKLVHCEFGVWDLSGSHDSVSVDVSGTQNVQNISGLSLFSNTEDFSAIPRETIGKRKHLQCPKYTFIDL